MNVWSIPDLAVSRLIWFISALMAGASQWRKSMARPLFTSQNSWVGEKSKEQGERSKEQGARSKEQGARSKEQGAMVNENG